MFFPCVVVCPVVFYVGDGASAESVEVAVDELAKLTRGVLPSMNHVPMLLPILMPLPWNDNAGNAFSLLLSSFLVMARLADSV